MIHKIGDKVRVVNPYSGGDFEVGDVVTIVRIGDEDGFEPNCYGAISPHDGSLWYLNEDEVAPIGLLPCPFCGSTKLKIDQKTSSSTKRNNETKRSDKLVVVTVRCNKCHTRGPTTSMWSGQFDRPIEALSEAAAEAWNRRST